MRLDYSNADITVEQNGAPMPAKPVDANGAPLGIVDVTVKLDNRHHLVVAPGRPSLFTLDFNLAATNSVDLTTTPATVTVTPALVASLDIVDQKDLRVRGPLVSVDTTAGTYVADVRPFNMRNDEVGPGDGAYRRRTRTFEINGTSYTGSAGLAALAAAGAGTATAAFGTLTTAIASSTPRQSMRAPACPARAWTPSRAKWWRVAATCSPCAARPSCATTMPTTACTSRAARCR